MFSKSAKKFTRNHRFCSSLHNKRTRSLIALGVGGIVVGGLTFYYLSENSEEKEKKRLAEAETLMRKHKPHLFDLSSSKINEVIQTTINDAFHQHEVKEEHTDTTKIENTTQGNIIENTTQGNSDNGSLIVETEENKEEENGEEGEDEEERIPKYDVVVIGGGTSGFSVLKELQLKEYEGSVLMISNSFLEQKPPLTHEFWKEENTEKLEKLVMDAVFGFRDKYRNDQFQFFAGTVMNIDPLDERILIKTKGDQSMVIAFDKCVLAMGSTPKTLDIPKPKDNKHITTYDNIKDFVYLHHIVAETPIQNVSIIGGDYLGTELAYAMLTKARRNNVTVSLFTKEGGVLGKYLPDYFGDYITKKLRNCGIDIKTNALVTEISEVNERLAIKYGKDGQEHITDHIVVSVGSTPNVELAQKIDLEIDTNNGGIVTSSYFQATPNIYAIGDVASYYNVSLGRLRSDHDQTAKLSGKYVARNIMGDLSSSYLAPKFKGKLQDEEYFGYGRIDSKLRTVSTWMRGPVEVQCSLENPDTYIVRHSSENEYEMNNEFKKGIIYYLDGQRIVGALGWNLDCYHADQVLYKKERKYETDIEVTRAISFEDLLIDTLIGEQQEKSKETENKTTNNEP